MLRKLIVVLWVLMGSPLLGQPFVSVHPPESTIANFPTCDGSYAGSKLRIATDGASASDCSTGAGSTSVVCWCDGTSWGTVGGGSPGGSDTQLQYNNAGAFGGASGLTTDGTHLFINNQFRTTSGADFFTDLNKGSGGSGGLRLYNGSFGNLHARLFIDGSESLFIEGANLTVEAGTTEVAHFDDDLTPAAVPLSALDDGTSHQVHIAGTATQADNVLEVDADGDGTLTDGSLVVDSSGITLFTTPHGEMYAQGSSTTITLTTQNVWYQWVDATCDDTAGMTCSTTTDDLIADTGMGGTYMCYWSASFTTDTNNQVISGRIAVDGAAQAECESQRKVGTGSDVGNFSNHCIVDVAAASAVTLEFLNQTSSGVVMTPIDVNTSCQRIGA